jgi:anti-anti-sigma factor
MTAITMIRLPARLDSVTAGEAEQSLRAALREQAKLIVDGSAVTYMSAAGVRALAGVLRDAEALRAHIVFCNFAGVAAECLDVSGFSHLLDVAGSREEAQARLNTG